MSEPIVGLLGVVAIFGFTFVWCWAEDKAKQRAKRKYDEQMAKYDRWKEINNNM